MELSLILAVVIGHFVSDFFFQEREDAEKKSHSIKHLTNHVWTYSVLMFMFICMAVSYTTITPYAALLGFLFVTHWITDFFTSKFNAAAWKSGYVKTFWCGIGFDQMIHYVTLFTYLHYTT